MAAMMDCIYFTFEGKRHEIALDTAAAPLTIAQLLAHVPARIDLHCAKIAGRHIFWHAPFIAPLEKGQDVLTVPPGTFLYWPERQFLELIYGELQAESAQITVLGQLTGDIQWLTELGDRLRQQQGHRIIWASLEPGRSNTTTEGTLPLRPERFGLDTPPDPELMADARFTTLRTARVQAWEAEPKSVTELVSRRGILLPFGPLAMAEGEFRKLQELLWRYAVAPASQYSNEIRAEASAFLAEAAITRIVGLCGMDECEDILNAAAKLLRDRPENHSAILSEMILYTGRMAAWLDLYIPWNDLNESVLAAYGARPSE